jgi:putative ABC transport system permease protein
MKYLPLIWAALFRRKTRTVLTVFSVMAAFLLFGLLDGVRVAFNSGGTTSAGVNRLVTTSKFTVVQALPQTILPRIQTVPGVRAVTWHNWFGGYYQDPKNQLPIIAVGGSFFDVFTDYTISAEQRQAFESTRTGAVVGEALARQFNWKIGDKIPITGAIYPNKATGETDWAFDLVGIYKARSATERGIERQLFFRWDYFDEANGFNTHDINWVTTLVNDPKQSEQVAKAIDAISANSDHETKTQTEQAFGLSFIKQIGDIGLMVSAIMGAVFFTLLLLTGNAMAQAVRERIPELATLKTIGFTDLGMLLLVLGEAVLLIALGGVLGLGSAALLMPVVNNASGGAISLPAVGPETWAIGLTMMVLIGALVGVLPATRAMRLRIADALADR